MGYIAVVEDTTMVSFESIGKAGNEVRVQIKVHGVYGVCISDKYRW